ncbi:MAG: amidohydrolase family protein [Lachnospiraceae bacterium]|nr:amidohydrolase family protein [Lachnospiraceae bacterium]
MITAELHAHVFMDGIDYKKSVERHKTAVDKESVKGVFQAYKDRGITCVREGGDHYGASLYAKTIAADYGITYLSPCFALYKEGNYGKVAGLSYADFTEFQERVAKAKELGADFIKIMVSGILDFDKYGVVSETDYTTEYITELVHVAHEEGFAVMAHASGTERVRQAAEAGVDSIEHGYYMDSETMDILKDKNILWVPTAATSANLRGTGRFNETEVERIAERHLSAIAEAYEKGVFIGCGSDAGAYAVLHGKGTIDEYELLKSIMGDSADEKLAEAEEFVKQKFRKER